MVEERKGFVPPENRHEGGEQEVIEIGDVKNGDELLARLPERFDGEAAITITGKVQGREETDTIEVRGDVVDIKLDREGDTFWALKAVHSDGSETLLTNGNFFERDGVPMADYTTTADEWDWKKEGGDLTGKLTPADRNNIARFDEISHVTIKVEK